MFVLEAIRRFLVTVLCILMMTVRNVCVTGSLLCSDRWPSCGVSRRARDAWLRPADADLRQDVVPSLCLHLIVRPASRSLRRAYDEP